MRHSGLGLSPKILPPAGARVRNPPTLKPHTFVVDNPESLNKSEILIGDYTRVAPFLYDLTNVKWLQATWAGAEDLFDRVDPAKPPPMVVTRFSNAHYGRMMSEYVVASMVNHERDLFKIFGNQKWARWEKEGNSKICSYRTISDLTVGILGVGTLGSCGN